MFCILYSADFTPLSWFDANFYYSSDFVLFCQMLSILSSELFLDEDDDDDEEDEDDDEEAEESRFFSSLFVISKKKKLFCFNAITFN